MTTIELGVLRTSELLRLYSGILTELGLRRVVRSRNAPAGDIAETLTAIALDGELAPPSAKSWDVRTLDSDRKVQVKCRVLRTSGAKGQVYSPFRSWDFETCVFVDLDSKTYQVVRAIEVPAAEVQAAAVESTWVRGFRIRVGHDLLAMPGAIDRTPEFQSAQSELDMVTARSPWRSRTLDGVEPPTG